MDGPSSIPYRIDQSAPNPNRCSGTRPVARGVFMGTAPIHRQENRGLDDRQINLGVVQPGERPAIYGVPQAFTRSATRDLTPLQVGPPVDKGVQVPDSAVNCEFQGLQHELRGAER